MLKVTRNLVILNAVVIIFCLSVFVPALDVSKHNFSAILLTALLTAIFLSLCTHYFFIRFDNKLSKTKISESLKSQLAEHPFVKLDTILSNIVEGVIIVGQDEKIITISQPLIDMLELRSKEAVGRSYWEIIRNDDINSLLKETLMKKTAYKKELEILFPQELYFDMQTSPLLDGQKKFLGVVAIFHDITELKRLEKVRSEFVANVSHELKTPLTSIKGFVETLTTGALNDTKSAKRFLEIIGRHTEKLENLVNDLLNLSAIESREVKWNFEPTVLSEVIDSVVNLYKEQITRKHQKLEIIIPKDIPKIIVDRLKIEQVFSNLISNAIKFTPDFGSITVEAKEKDNFVCVGVKDTGVGIPSEHLPRVFERFYLVDKSRSKELGGTGLGLAIVKHIVQAHQGKVSVESELKKGSIFLVFLPKFHSNS